MRIYYLSGLVFVITIITIVVLGIKDHINTVNFFIVVLTGVFLAFGLIIFLHGYFTHKENLKRFKTLNDDYEEFVEWSENSNTKDIY